MKTHLLLAASATALLLAAFPASAQTKYPATLEGHAVLPAMTLVPAPADARWGDIAAGGETNMGAAFHQIANALSAEQMPGRQLPPVLVLASDGYPTDDFESGLEALFASTQAQNAIRLAIAIGGEADLEVLERFIRHPGIKPLRANNASDLVRHIKWAATAPVKTASSPTNAPDPLAPIAQRTVQEAALKADVSDLVW